MGVMYDKSLRPVIRSIRLVGVLLYGTAIKGIPSVLARISPYRSVTLPGPSEP
ncbi:hypothetical protein D3C85_1299460 [compost metagenome]